MKKLFIFLLIVVVSLFSYQYFFKAQGFPGLPYLPSTTPNNYDALLKIGNLELMTEVVNTPSSRAQGLSGRKSICRTCGMLFDFGVEDTIPTFWMKDMIIPIDIIWINNGKIVGIEKSVQPEPGKSDQELTKYSPPGVIDYVLEVNAVFSESQGIEVGQIVTLP